MATPAQLNAQLAGIQLAVFEIVWPAVPGLASVHIEPLEGGVELYCAAATILSENDRADCDRLLSEIVELALPGARAVVQFGTSPPANALEVMSPRLFRNIAKTVAPWRLEEGR